MVDYCKLKWVKNIKHQYDEFWANLAYDSDSGFSHLQWKRNSITNAKKPQKSDLILLGQRGKFTHLVEVIDDEPKLNSNSDKVSLDFPIYREVKVLWKAPIFEKAPRQAPRQMEILKFRMGWRGGKALDLDNIKGIKNNFGDLESFQKHVVEVLKPFGLC